MSGKSDDSEQRPTAPAKGKLTPEALRALREAEQRRRDRDTSSGEGPKEIGGRNGPDPSRYGDWEKDGIISDF